MRGVAHDSEQCEETEHGELQTQRTRRPPIDTSTAKRLARTFQAIANPTRVRILSLLADTELCVGDLALALDMSISAISHQLRLLRRLRVVRKRRDGKHIYYALNDEHIRDLFERGLEHVQHE